MSLYQLPYRKSSFTEILVSSLDGHDNDLFEKQIREYGDRHSRKTNVKAHMTDLSMTQHENWRELSFDIVKNGVLRLSPPIVTKQTVNWAVTHIWGNLYSHGDFAVDHHHIPAVWSFVYYVKVPYDSPGLVFRDLDYVVNPREGDFVLFPSHLMHGVRSNMSKEERISISGNICQIFEISKENEYVYDIEA